MDVDDDVTRKKRFSSSFVSSFSYIDFYFFFNSMWKETILSFYSSSWTGAIASHWSRDP